MYRSMNMPDLMFMNKIDNIDAEDYKMKSSNNQYMDWMSTMMEV